MAHRSLYNGQTIDAALEKGRSLRVVNNGWVRLTSSNDNPYDLNSLTTAGNYTVDRWINGPVGPETITPLNIVVLIFSGTTYQFVDTGLIRYVRFKNGDMFSSWSKDQNSSTIYPSPNEPQNPSMNQIWLCTSGEFPELKVFNGSNWVNIGSYGAMSPQVYDPFNRATDIYEYIDNQIAAAGLNDISESINNHITDLTIHVTQEEKEIWSSSATMSDVANAANNLYTSLETTVTNEVNNNITEIETLTDTVNNYESTLNTHIADTALHPSTEQQDAWSAKAEGDHTHDLDGRVTIDAAHLTGELSEDVMPYATKERAYPVNSIDEMYALTKNPIHDGDMIYVIGDSPEDLSWYIVVDDAQLESESTYLSLNEYSISDTDKEWYRVCYGDGKFVVVTYNSNICAYSNDGINWTEGTISDTNRKWYGVCYGNEKFIALANDSNIFAYSTDGITWTESTISDTSRKWQSVCYYAGKFIAITSSFNVFAYSTDGISWTEGTIGDTKRYWNNVCYGKGKYIAVANMSNIFAYSTDGINWAEGTISNSRRTWSSVCYGNGRFVAIVYNSSIFAYSDDGTTWTEGTISDTGRYWKNICYGNGKFIAIASDSNVFAYSDDGITWTEDTISDTNRKWESVCYGDDRFVAVACTSNSVTNIATISNATLAFKPISSSLVNWSNITNLPTTLEGYGITDALSNTALEEVQTNLTEVEESLPSTTDFSTIIETQTAVNMLNTNIDAIYASLSALDSAISKLESITE